MEKAAVESYTVEDVDQGNLDSFSKSHKGPFSPNSGIELLTADKNLS